MNPSESDPAVSSAPTASTDAVAANLSKLLRVEDGPELGSGKLSFADDQLYTSLCHLFALIIWLWKKEESPAVDAHGKEALNMAITWIIVLFPLSIIAGIMPRFIAPLFSLATSLLSLGFFALAIYGLLQARKGKLLRYPFNLRLIK